MTTPATVPTLATTVLRVGPPIRYMVTAVVTAQISTEVHSGGQPR